MKQMVNYKKGILKDYFVAKLHVSKNDVIFHLFEK